MGKKRRIILIGGILVLIFIVVWIGFEWKAMKKIHFVKQMGSGINMGNSLDSTGLRQYRPDASDIDYEVFWNNPSITKENFQSIYEAGFRTVRIPVTWEDHIDDNGNISEIWMKRVVEVVDMALNEQLYVILNTHHEYWLNIEEDKEDEIYENLRQVWSQIAVRFKDYGEHLLFEGMNEPRLRDSEHEWDEGTSKLREIVNRLNSEFVETIRKTGDKNRTRYLLVTPYASNSLKETLEALEVPEGNIIISVHAYLPYNFCQNEEGTTKWDKNNQADTEEIVEAFENMSKLFTEKGIPVILTEFGSGDKDNISERVKWAAYYKELAKENKVSCIWWDNGSTYKLLNREDNTWVYPELVDSIVN